MDKVRKATDCTASGDTQFTPAYAVDPVIRLVAKAYPDRTHGSIQIYEATGFDGSLIHNEFLRLGYDIENNVGDDNKFIDFFDDEYEDYIADFDVIITNPPFSLKDEFIERCYYFHEKYGVAFALLLPVPALQSVTRGKMFDKYGIECCIINQRVQFISEFGVELGSPAFGVGWFTKGLNPDKLTFVNVDKSNVGIEALIEIRNDIANLNNDEMEW